MVTVKNRNEECVSHFGNLYCSILYIFNFRDWEPPREREPLFTGIWSDVVQVS